jgi:hypothetical protein
MCKFGTPLDFFLSTMVVHETRNHTQLSIDDGGGQLDVTSSPQDIRFVASTGTGFHSVPTYRCVNA